MKSSLLDTLLTIDYACWPLHLWLKSITVVEVFRRWWKTRLLLFPFTKLSCLESINLFPETSQSGGRLPCTCPTRTFRWLRQLCLMVSVTLPCNDRRSFSSVSVLSVLCPSPQRQEEGSWRATQWENVRIQRLLTAPRSPVLYLHETS